MTSRPPGESKCNARTAREGAISARSRDDGCRLADDSETTGLSAGDGHHAKECEEHGEDDAHCNERDTTVALAPCLPLFLEGVQIGIALTNEETISRIVNARACNVLLATHIGRPRGGHVGGVLSAAQVAADTHERRP
jgi:hypothetical protein